MAAPSETSPSVRMPIGLSLRLRGRPSAIPATAAATRRITTMISKGVVMSDMAVLLLQPPRRNFAPQTRMPYESCHARPSGPTLRRGNHEHQPRHDGRPAARIPPGGRAGQYHPPLALDAQGAAAWPPG